MSHLVPLLEFNQLWQWLLEAETNKETNDVEVKKSSVPGTKLTIFADATGGTGSDAIDVLVYGSK
jgi:hypothetical protein